MKAILDTEIQAIATAITSGALAHGYRYTTELKSKNKLHSTVEGTQPAIMYLIKALYEFGEFGLVDVTL